MRTRAIRDLLAEHELFADLDPAYLDLVAGCGSLEVVPAGTALAHEGDPADRFYLIREGRIAIEVHVPPRGGLVVETLGAGDVVGWSWLFPPHRWSFDVTALDTTHVVVLDGACLRGKCDDDPRLGHALMRRFARIMVRRLESTRLRLLDLYGADPHDPDV